MNHFKQLWICLITGIFAIAQPDSRFGEQRVQRIVFTNVHLIAMDKDTIQRHQTVHVEDGVIVGIEPFNDRPLPKEGLIIDASGLYMVPGLGDMHIHQGALYGDDLDELLLFLVNGVTTVRNMNGTRKDIALRQKIREGAQLGPRFLTTSPFMDGHTVRDVTTARQQVAAFKAAGYDALKVHGDMIPEVYDALMEEARKLEIPVVGHVQRQRPLADSLNQKSIAHVEEFLYVLNQSEQPIQELLKFLDKNHAVKRMAEHRRDKVAESLVTARVAVTPTLVIYDVIHHYFNDDKLTALMGRDVMRYVPEAHQQAWNHANNRYRRNRPPGDIDASRLTAHLGGYLRQMVGYFQEHRVDLVLGSDAFGLVIPGFSVHDELKLLVTSGLTPYQAIKTATVNSARFRGESDRGILAAGMKADLVLLTGNPLEDISNTARIEGILHERLWIDASTRTAMMAHLQKLAESGKTGRASGGRCHGSGVHNHL